MEISTFSTIETASATKIYLKVQTVFAGYFLTYKQINYPTNIPSVEEMEEHQGHCPIIPLNHFFLTHLFGSNSQQKYLQHTVTAPKAKVGL